MHVGNDVVDLRDPEARPGAVHPRFDARVFTSCERARIRAAAAAERVRWSLWAAKESAFKVARKLDDGLPFHPRRFVVRELARDRAAVVHQAAGRFRVWLDEARDWIHATAVPGDQDEVPTGPPLSALAVLDEARASAAELSVRVRELLRDAVAPLVEADPTLLEVVTVDGIPRLRLAGRPLPVDLSLSHHGRVVGCSWLLPTPSRSTAAS